MVERIVLLHADRGDAVDGIRDHTRELATVLRRQGLEVDLSAERNRVLGKGGQSSAARAIWRLRGEGRRSMIFFQYSPFCYARWGFAPLLPATVSAIKARRDRPLLVLMVHEPYVPMRSWRSSLIGAWQRLQLAALELAVDVVFTSIEPWAEMLEEKLPRREVRHLPVGSNFPDRRPERQRQRRAIGATDDTLVVASMGRDHPGWLGDYVVEAANAVQAGGKPTVLLALGADAPALSGLDPSIRVEAPGYLEPGELAARLAAADIFLAPLIDGVSTRRGTLMAALQHALPVVATAGPLTDPLLLGSGSALRLVTVGDPASFAREAARLAADGEERAAVGAEARTLYEENFDWPVIAGRMLDSLPAG